MGKGFDVDLDLTVCRRLGCGKAGRTPKIHPRVGDAGCPGEIDSILIVECQVAIVEARIQPVHVTVTKRHTDTQA